MGVHAVLTGRSTSHGGALFWQQFVFWKYLFCTEVGRDRRGQRKGRQTVFAHVEIVGVSLLFMHRPT